MPGTLGRRTGFANESEHKGRATSPKKWIINYQCYLCPLRLFFFLSLTVVGRQLSLPLLYLLLPLPVVSYCRSFGSFGAYAETRCRVDFAGRHSGSLLNRTRQEKIKSPVLMVSVFVIDYCFEENK